jgi:hypothetical protein
MCAIMAGPPKAVIPRRKKEPKIAAALGLGEDPGGGKPPAILSSLIYACSPKGSTESSLPDAPIGSLMRGPILFRAKDRGRLAIIIESTSRHGNEDGWRRGYFDVEPSENLGTQDEEGHAGPIPGQSGPESAVACQGDGDDDGGLCFQPHRPDPGFHPGSRVP